MGEMLSFDQIVIKQTLLLYGRVILAIFLSWGVLAALDRLNGDPFSRALRAIYEGNLAVSVYRVGRFAIILWAFFPR